MGRFLIKDANGMSTVPAMPREVGNPPPEKPTNPATIVTPHYPGTHHGQAIYSGHRIEGIDKPLPETALVPHPEFHEEHVDPVSGRIYSPGGTNQRSVWDTIWHTFGLPNLYAHF